ncbi:MAG: response regulator [Acidobacteriota bacterium]
MKSRILLIDDDEHVLDGLRAALRKKRYRMLATTSPEEGLRMLEECGADVVVSDENMPEMSGTRLLSHVAERHPETMRIMLTGATSLDVALAALNAGDVHRYLTKPCRPSELALAIDQVLEVQQLRRDGQRLLRLARRQQSALRELAPLHPALGALLADEDAFLLDEDDDATLESVARDAERRRFGF